MSDKIKIGDEITIAGFGRGRNGQIVIDGHNPITKRKCKAVREARFVITAELKTIKITPSIK